jgi:hypothetical protein
MPPPFPFCPLPLPPPPPYQAETNLPKVAGWGRHSCLLWLACLFTVLVRLRPSPSFWSSGPPTLFAMCPIFFFQLLVYCSVFFLFSLGGSQSVQGAMLICPREYLVPLICSPGGLCLPSRLGAGIWWHRSSPGFSIQHGMGMLCVG